MQDKIILWSELEYRELFRKEFISSNIQTFDGFPILCKEWHFDHLFYRNKGSQPKFDHKTAQSMIVIKSMITNEISWVEVYENVNPQNSRTERSYILIYEWLYVILWFNSSRSEFYLITAYYKSHWDIKKFKKNMFIHQIK